MNEVQSPGIICTRFGHRLNVIDPVETTIDIRDIAYGLGSAIRFGGHSYPRMTVAEHSCLVYHKVWISSKRNYALSMAALLHDAEEAYMSDMPTPVKVFFPEYCKVADNLRKVIYSTFGLPTSWAVDPPQDIQVADRACYEIERHHVMPDVAWWNNPHGDCGMNFKPKNSEEATQGFLSLFHHIQELRNG